MCYIINKVIIKVNSFFFIINVIFFNKILFKNVLEYWWVNCNYWGYECNWELIGVNILI